MIQLVSHLWEISYIHERRFFLRKKFWKHSVFYAVSYTFTKLNFDVLTTQFVSFISIAIQEIQKWAKLSLKALLERSLVSMFDICYQMKVI